MRSCWMHCREGLCQRPVLEPKRPGGRRQRRWRRTTSSLLGKSRRVPLAVLSRQEPQRLRTHLSCADVIRDGGVPSPPLFSTLPATEQWVEELLELFARPAARPCQYLDSLKGPVVGKVVSLAAFLGFAHGVSALAFPLIVPSNLLYTCEHSLQGRAQILTPGW